VAFCGIARPAEFFGSLRQAGKTVLRELAFRDHQKYAAPDIERLRRMALECGAEAFVTTEKDAVRLDASMREALGLPLLVTELQTSFLDEDEVVGDLLRMIGTRQAGN